MRGMQTAITWFFTRVSSGLIVEDDVLVHPNSISATEDLLERFKNDTNVGSISLFAKKSFPPARTLIWTKRHWPHIWGWATWSDRWRQYEYEVEVFSAKHDYLRLVRKLGVKKFRIAQSILRRHSEAKNTWDTQWLYTHLKNGWRVLSPSRTLTTNIGFDDRATHIGPAPSWVRSLDNYNLKQKIFASGKLINIS